MATFFQFVNSWQTNYSFNFMWVANSGNADLNQNGEITVSELRDYLFDRVSALTKGGQNLTSRRENLEFDFRIW